MDYKRILTVQDISCVGQCSMTVALPILSAWGHETCILPTAILSTHTGGFSRPIVHHLGDDISSIWKHWQRERISFDAIYTGYLGSIDAVKSVLELSEQMLAPGGELIVDPAMADHGRLYSGLTDAYADAMRELCARADILLPNITEAAMLSGQPYSDVSPSYVTALMAGINCNRVVLTGVGYTENETGIAVLEGNKVRYHFHRRVEKNYHGTGDIFAACFTGARLHGKSVFDAAEIAAELTGKAIENTFRAPAHVYGVKFETILGEITDRICKG